MDESTIVPGEFNTLLSVMGRYDRKKISKVTAKLNSTINQLGLFDIHRIFYSETSEYTLVSNSHGTFTKIDHNLGHKTYLD